MPLLRTMLPTASTAPITMLPVAITTMDGCGTDCTPLERVTADTTLDAEEQSLVDQYGSFNLVGDCVGEQDLACEERLPDACASACSTGATCVQVEIEIIDCNDIVEWSDLLPGEDAGATWKRTCVEISASA